MESVEGVGEGGGGGFAVALGAGGGGGLYLGAAETTHILQHTTSHQFQHVLQQSFRHASTILHSTTSPATIHALPTQVRYNGLLFLYFNVLNSVGGFNCLLSLEYWNNTRSIAEMVMLFQHLFLHIFLTDHFDSLELNLSE